MKDEGVDFDALPSPAHHLIDLKKYNNVLARQAHTASVQSSRGCPAACVFCDIRKTKFRARSPEHVVAELKKLHALGTRDFFFVDDTITIDKKRVLRICDLIQREKLDDIGFKVSARVDTVNPEVLAALKAAGCYRIHYGVETGTERLLKYLEKGAPIERVKRAFKWTREAGIETYAYMMIGIPTETREEMFSSVDFAIKLKTDYAQFSICTPYPKTELYYRLLKDGTIPHDYWQDFAKDPREGFKVKFWNRDYTEPQLRELQDEAMRRFYGRRAYIVQELRKVVRDRSVSMLVTKARVGVRVLLPKVARVIDHAAAKMSLYGVTGMDALRVTQKAEGVTS
jgi:radical SAM superfamily enzyme YgiQ (UPF0313 family)